MKKVPEKEVRCWRCNTIVGYSEEEIGVECENCHEFLHA